jgi:hypothetical protein
MKNMKMNKWTMGLAAAGVVTLSSVAQAQDAAAGAEALAASTTLSGYVSTGYKYADSAQSGYFRAGDGNKAFSLDVVDLKLSSAQGDGAMDTGYTVELWMGPAASDIGTQDSGTGGTVELMQANIDLRVADIDLKIGQFGTVVGNDVYNYNENALYTHSFAFQLEPTHHTGLLASYTVSDDLQISAGLANTTGPETNGSSGGSGTSKTYLASISYTLPSGTGQLAGTELYYGLVSGSDNQSTSSSGADYHYASITLPELVSNLSISASWDHVEYDFAAQQDSNIVGLHLGYQLNADTALNVRYEMGDVTVFESTGTGNGNDGTYIDDADGLQSLTIGVSHKIWENVISRIEYRRDDKDNSGANSQDTFAANLIYSF